MRTVLSLLLLTFLFSGAAFADGLDAQVDRQRMGLDETLTLQVTADGKMRGDPDWTPLTRDFEILGQSQSNHMSLINGAFSQTREWTLQLSPKDTGTLEIPALTLDGAQSQPLRIEVLAQASQATGEPDPLRVWAEVDTEAPYVQQPLDYRVKIAFLDQPQRAALSMPQVDGATIEQVGDDRVGEQFIDGRRYTLVERRYLVTPQRSGDLVIQGPRLDATLPASRSAARASDPFGNFDPGLAGRLFQDFPGISAPGRRLIEHAEDIRLKVRSQPSQATQSWLPARSVELSEQWNPNPPQFKVGEPVTRILTITAEGARAAQLPDLDPSQIAGAQVYPDRPHSEEDRGGGGKPAALKQVEIALVPTRSGPLTLPEVRLPWWDTQADAPREAVIPARTVEVAPNPDVSIATESKPAAPPQPAASAPMLQPAEVAADEQPAPSASQTTDRWPWLVALALGLGWLSTLGWIWRRARARPAVDRSAQPSALSDLSKRRRAIASACAASDTRAARAALLDWGRERWPDDPPSGLNALGQRIGDPESAATLARIDQALYAPDRFGWDGPAAWAVLEPRLKVAEGVTGARAIDPLPERYPR